MNRLFISCCGRKLEHSARAIDLYKSRQFNLAQRLLEIGWEVTIISSKHGFLDANCIIEPYDQRMTANRSQEILLRGLRENISATKNYVFGGELYRRIIRELDPCVTELVGANRGNGDHYSALKQLSEISN